MKYAPDRHTTRSRAPVPLQPDLPPADTVRWVARRKAEVVAAVHNGVLSMREACQRYSLSAEEFLEWERHYKQGGRAGLQVSARLH
jgi:transposase-like protein